MQELGFVAKKYMQFVEEHGYIPRVFNPYNCADIAAGGVAPTATTQCGSTTSSATVLIIEEIGGTNMQDKIDNQPEIKVVGMLDISSHDHSRRVHDPDGLCPTLTAVAGGTHHIKIFDPTKYRVRKLTPTEYGRLQAFPVDDGWEQVVSDSQAYKQFGNAVTKTVVTAIGKSIKAFLDKNLRKAEPEEVTDFSDIAPEDKATIIANAGALEARDEKKTATTETAIKTDDKPAPKTNGLEFFSNEELLAELNRRMAAHA